MIGNLPLADSWEQLQQTLMTLSAEEAGMKNEQMDITGINLR